MKTIKYLNPEELQFAKEVIKTKDPTLAYINLYPDTSKTSASAIARNKIANSRQIKDYISDALDKQGLSLLNANSRLKSILDANKPIVVNNEIVDYPDNNVRLMALEKLYKLHGLLTNNVQIDNRQVNIEIAQPTQEQQAKLSSILDELTTLNEKLDLTKNRVVPQTEGL